MNEIHYLDVPENINYLSDWTDLENKLEKGHIILNKKITGCGATSYFLNHPSMKVILCSPRILLLKDKFKKGKEFLHWFRNNDKDLVQSEEEDWIETNDENTNELENYKNLLRDYVIKNYQTNIRKILVTYDSLKYVISTLRDFGENLNEYVIVVDEFHSIFQDSRFKPDVELNFMDILDDVKNVIFLSATPILKEFTDLMEKFKDLPYYELKWPESKMIKANINRIKTSSLTEEACKIINSYLLGLFPSKVVGNEVIESKEAVLFFNSVNDIIKIITKTKLKSEQCNILCSNNDYNKSKLKKKIKQEIGNIPDKGEPHKMFTFCTRTAFLGTDFYSTCASTYIFADPNIDSLSIDISMDLPQIIGRQRLDSNIFKNDITLFYKTTKVLEDLSKFEETLDQKVLKTNTLLQGVSNMNSSERQIFTDKLASSIKYSNDYIGYSVDKSGNKILKFNSLVYFSEKRAWQIQNKNFKDGYTLLKTIQNEGFSTSEEIKSNYYTEFYENFNSTRSFEIRMKLYCDFVENFSQDPLKSYSFIPSKYHEIYNILGPTRLKALYYREKDIKTAISILGDTGKIIKDELMKILKIGDRRSNSDLKNIFSLIYNNLNLKINPKATDIKNYFEVKRARIKEGGEGFEIISYNVKNELNNNCSIFETSLKTKNPINLNVNDILPLIKTDEMKQKIFNIRNCQDKEERNYLKLYTLPTVCWNGTFSEKGREYLKSYSSYLLLDIDNITEEKINYYKDKLKNISYIKAVFISPSGKGLKVLIQHNNINPKDHRELFIQVSMDLNIEELDMSVSDLARGNYLSYDPNIYINDFCTSFNFIANPSYKYSTKEEKNLIYKSKNPLEDNKLIQFLINCWENQYEFKEGNRHNIVFKSANDLFKAGIEKSRSLSCLLAQYESITFKNYEISNIVNYIYSNHDEFGKDRERLLKIYNL